MSMKNSNKTIGNRTRDLLACSAVPEPTALLQCPIDYYVKGKAIPGQVWTGSEGSRRMRLPDFKSIGK